jgi:hypothetical protein
MLRQPDGAYRCRQHDVVLLSPVRVFCKNLMPHPADDPTHAQWVASAINTDELEQNMLYTWVQTTIRDDQDDIHIHLDCEAIAPLTSYMTWSAGTFWEVMRRIRDRKHENYRQHGYNVDE